MRTNLKKYFGSRRVFQGTFKRFGIKSGYKGPLKTVLLVDVIDYVTKEVMTDHLWFTCGKRFDILDLQEGDVVQFSARVTEYLKGYQGGEEGSYEDVYGQELDYRLSYPTKSQKVNVVPSEILLIYGEQRKGFSEEALRQVEKKNS